MRVKKNILLIFSSLIALLVGLTVIKSGFQYTFDADELYHAQQAFLIIKGFEPYTQFFINHSVIFHWFISPVILFGGTNIDTIYALRALMIVLFLLRLLFSFMIIKKLFGKIAALFFIFLLFLDPFNAMTSMQIRPDNLMLTVYLAGLLVMIKGVNLKSPAHFFISGLLLGLSFLITMKMAPSILAIFIIFGIYSLSIRKFSDLICLIIGFIVPLTIYSLIYLFNGSFPLMFQEVFIDSPKLIMSMYAPFGFLYQPYNAYIFGTADKPLTWVYVWLIPLWAAIGTYIAVAEVFSKKIIERIDLVKLVLVATLWIQWLILFFLNGVFVQYYLIYTWFMPMVAGYFYYYFLKNNVKNITLQNIFSVIFFILFIVFSVSSIKGNLAHAKISDKSTPELLKSYWKIIPENARVFPSILFRPITYTVPYGLIAQPELLPSSMRKKLPPVIDVLEANKADYIIVDDINVLNKLDNRFSSYLEEKFSRIKDGKIYVRKK